jgi:hypothetical protein
MPFYAQFAVSELRNILSAARREAAYADPRRRQNIYNLEIDPITQELEIRGIAA